jgi:hypothetical protein
MTKEPEKKPKDPDRVAAAYRGKMPKVVESPRWTLKPEDYQKWAKDLFVFMIPAMIAFLTVLQRGGTLEEAFIAVYTWLLMALMNLLQKFASDKKYIV